MLGDSYVFNEDKTCVWLFNSTQYDIWGDSHKAYEHKKALENIRCQLEHLRQRNILRVNDKYQKSLCDSQYSLFIYRLTNELTKGVEYMYRCDTFGTVVCHIIQMTI